MPDADSPVIAAQSNTLMPLRVQNLSFRVGDQLLFDALNFNIEGPGISVIMGANGAGKSLLVRLLHGLLMPQSGQVCWGGRPNDDNTRKRQALVFQKPVLLRRSVAANIDFVLAPKTPAALRRRDQILREAGLFERSAQAARQLSGGEQQRLALARALATEPQVLLLDEPSASLDPATTLHIESLLTRTRDKGVKVILVTHDLGQARRLADDVLFMHAGRVLEHSSAAEFFAAPSSPQAQAYLDGRLVL